MHILIIEDEENSSAALLRRDFRMNGYETDICFDGDKGFACV